MIYHVQFPGLGLELTINRVAFSIGSFPVYWYGILIAVGMMLAVAFMTHFAPDFGVDGDRMMDAFLIGVVCGVACARAYYVVFAPFEYESLWEMIDLRDGGIAIYGGIIGGFLFGGLACILRKVPVLPMFDLTAMGFLIGQSIGRWGNFANQEAFGTNTSLPWGMFSENTQAYLSAWKDSLLAQGISVDPLMPVHPTFLYESLWCAVAFVILVITMKHRKFNGQLLCMYIILYGGERFFVEGLRTDSLMLPGIEMRVSQLVALVSVLVALMVMLLLYIRQGGKPLMVPLAIRKLSCSVPVDYDGETELIACASHLEFVEKTLKMNRYAESYSAVDHTENAADLEETQKNNS